MNAFFLRVALALLMLPLFCQSQVGFFRHEYTNIQQSTWELNQFISMSQRKGNLPGAQQTLAETQDPFLAYLKEAFLSHQLLGTKSLNDGEPSSTITPEQEAYAQLWVSYLTGNTEDAEQQQQAFKEIYPESRLLIRFDIKKYMDYVLANAFNKDADTQAQLLGKIDSLFAHASLTPDEHVFYSLARLDIITSKLLSRPDIGDTLIFQQLCELWQQYPELLNSGNLLSDLRPCEDSLCVQIKQLLQEQVWKELGLSPLQILAAEVSKIVRRYQEVKDNDTLLARELPVWEATLQKRMGVEKDAQELELMKAMTSAALAPIDGTLYQKLQILLSKDFVNIPISQELRSQLNPTLPKEDLESLALARIEVLEEVLGRKMTPPSEEDGEEVSQEDYFFLLGYLLYSTEVIMNQKRALAAITKFSQKAPLNSQKTSWKLFQLFWQENPFYFEQVNPYASFYYPLVEDQASLDSALWAIDQTLLSYPACVNLVKLRMNFLQQYSDYYVDRGAYVTDLMRTVITLFSLRQEEGMDSQKDRTLQAYLVAYEVDWMESYWGNDQIMETLLGFLSKKDVKELADFLDKKLEDRPYQGNLVQLRAYFQ